MKNTIIVIGDIILDRYLFTHPIKLSPEAPIIVVKKDREEYRLGGSANVTYNIKQLGGNPLLIGIKGLDKEANILHGLLLEKKIDNLVFDFSNKSTTVKTRILSNSQQVIRIDEEDITPVDGRFQKLLEGKFKGSLNPKGISAIIISDYGKGVITEGILRLVSSFCKEHNILLALDPYTPHSVLYRKCLEHIDLITPNLKQAEEMYNYLIGIEIPKESDKELKNLAAFLSNRLKCNNVLITLSEKGMFLSYMKEKEFIFFLENAIKTEITDVTGCGDSVISAFIFSYLRDLDAIKAMKYANLVASITATKLGTYAPTLKEIQDERN